MSVATPLFADGAEVGPRLEPDDLCALSASLPEPDETLQLGAAELALYQAKELYNPSWRSEELRLLVREARRSFDRYGGVPLFDAYDPKSAVYLARARYHVLTPERVPIRAEEWLSFRYVPGDGTPAGNPDLDNCLCKDRPLVEALRSYLTGKDSELGRVVSISRMCAISPYTLRDDRRGLPARWLTGRGLRYGAGLLVLINSAALDHHLGRWDYQTGLCHPELLRSSFTLHTEDGHLYPRYTPAYQVLGLSSPREVRLDRSHEAYRYPGYFLDRRQLMRALRHLLREKMLSERTLQHYLGEVRSQGSGEGSGEWYRNLGRLLTVQGPLVGSPITGEALRAYLDRSVDDGPTLYLFEVSSWKDELEKTLEVLVRRAYRRSYPGKPLLLEAARAHQTKQVAYEPDGTAWVTDSEGRKHRVPPDRQYDVTQATMFGLNERLTISASPTLQGGETLRERFNREWERYTEAFQQMEEGRLDYGVYAFYPDRGELVRYCPPYWHRVVSVASNSKLIADPEGKLRWEEIQRIFAQTTVAIAGGSVGNNILHGVVAEMRPRHVKIADKSVFKMENINRVRLTYKDLVESNAARLTPLDPLLRNKAVAAAVQLYAADPYLTVHVYDEGITEANVARFLEGDDEEPPADIVVDEMDDLRMKLRLREEARARRIPLVMFSDIGSAVQVDILRYDLDPTLSLAYGVEDETLYRALAELEENPTDRRRLLAFATTFLGPDFLQGELKAILEGHSEVPTATLVPQLGSTAAMAGAIAAETIARLSLGEEYPPRLIFNKHTFEAKVYR
ncbi:MAG: hypothetical protein KatS3mg115_0727 [Candidatus Poribacteria bacterium]|nr:MAG: hypothetical protein KatS3mg115_0727 [Candidatus Poribacteria bacterium]